MSCLKLLCKPIVTQTVYHKPKSLLLCCKGLGLAQEGLLGHLPQVPQLHAVLERHGDEWTERYAPMNPKKLSCECKSLPNVLLRMQKQACAA